MAFRVPSQVRHVAIPEIEVPGKRLGRHVWHDERSKGWQAERAQKLVDALHRAVGLPLNQANVGSCTGEAEIAALNAEPNLGNNAPKTQADAYAVYHDETVLEGQPWPPNDPGGSGLMVCRAGKRRGWLRSYRHAFGIDHALHAQVLRPVMYGVPWFDSFDTPDENGLVELTPRARVRGGHEFTGLELDVVNELVWFAQSWGQWGVARPQLGLQTGAFCMRFATLERLLREGGDATVPIV